MGCSPAASPSVARSREMEDRLGIEGTCAKRRAANSDFVAADSLPSPDRTTDRHGRDESK